MERVLRDRIARDLFDEGSQKARFTLPKRVRSPFIRTTHPDYPSGGLLRRPPSLG